MANDLYLFRVIRLITTLAFDSELVKWDIGKPGTDSDKEFELLLQ